MGAKRLLRTLIFFALWLERDNHSCRLSMRTTLGSQASMTACKPGRRLCDMHDRTLMRPCLHRAHAWGVTAAACLDIADIHMAILNPAGPPIGVDGGLL
jgi:hypothetical protein